MADILGFNGENSFLSNFHPSTIRTPRLIYPTVEHFFQAHKTLDLFEHTRIASRPSPGAAKKEGRNVELRQDWEDVKDEIMRTALRLKFIQSPDLWQKLVSTGGSYLEETNHWDDTYWGVCNGKGLNMLGHLLMQVREELINIVNAK